MNTPFLQLVANDLRERCNNDFSHTWVIFPSKRAGLFLDEYLATDDAPIWSPHYLTIDECFQQLSPLQLADTIDTVCRIYHLYAKICRQEGQTPDTLDHFYGWAERLLKDFDDMDKSLVNAQELFVNLSDLREIESKNFLSEEQTAVLQRFFKDFDPEHNSYVRERFLQLWRKLPYIYQSLKSELQDEHLA